mgnify:CR=1 FL=1
MMAASKTGLPRYVSKDGKEIFAARITKITPYDQAGSPPGSMVLHLGELDKKVNMVGQWVREHLPQVGGYFVCYDLSDGHTLCRYEGAQAIAEGYAQ